MYAYVEEKATTPTINPKRQKGRKTTQDCMQATQERENGRNKKKDMVLTRKGTLFASIHAVYLAPSLLSS